MNVEGKTSTSFRKWFARMFFGLCFRERFWAGYPRPAGMSRVFLKRVVLQDCFRIPYPFTSNYKRYYPFIVKRRAINNCRFSRSDFSFILR